MCKNVSSLVMKSLIGITGIIMVVGCSGSPTPIETQALIEPIAQPSLNTPAVTPPSETSPPVPTEADLGDPEIGSQEGYPYPAPGESESSPQNEDLESFSPTPGYPSPENEAAAIAPVLKTELEATDPSTFNLASGEIQLVEFFAFW